MARFRYTFWVLGCAVCGLIFTPAPSVHANPEAPAVGMLITNVMTQMSCVQTQGFRGKYSYTRTKAMEELSDKGTVKEKEEKKYEVFPIYGRPFSRLVQANGKPLPEKERRKETEREVGTRERLAPVKSQPFTSKKEMPLTPEILGRFAFKIEGQETINGRTNWVLSFKPRGEELPENKFQDRIVNKMSGKVWVDALEYEISKADLHLVSHVNLVGGVVGTLRRLDYLLERKRVDDGVWFTSKTEADIEGREVVLSRHVRLREECNDFKKVAPDEAVSGQ